MYLGIDIGGTKILALAVTGKGKVRGRCKKKLQGRDPRSVVDRALRCAGEALEQASASARGIQGVGVAVPSAVKGGVALIAPALGWRKVNVAKLFQRHFKGPVHVGNDVNLGVAAEWRFGAARGDKNVVGLFIGTGVGGAIIQRGRLLQGKDGLAGELGHMIVLPGGALCGCGNAGCLEAYASKTALLARIKHAIYEEGRSSLLQEEVSPGTRMIGSGRLHAAYQAGDPLCREVLVGGLKFLAPALGTVINTLSPDRVVLGGGVIEAFGDPLVRRIRAAARPFIFGPKSRAKIIVQSALGDDAVPLGAARLRL